jgi:branched-chain amino acid transport system substrate-binding protein
VAATTLSDIAVGGGAVWLSDPLDGTVWRVETRPRLVMRTITVGPGVSALAFGDGSLWAANGLRGTLSRIDPETNRVVDTITIGNTPRDVAVGDGDAWVAVAGGTSGAAPAASGEALSGIEPLPLSSCGPVVHGGDAPAFVIASDFPLQGGGRIPALQMSESIAFVLRQHGFRAGRFNVGYQSCDDSTAQSGTFDSDKCTANAKAYAETADVIGVIGPYNSACALGLIPVANRAPGGPLAVVTPSASLTALTQPDPLAPPGTLEQLYPTGNRNFARVSGTDAVQAAANAMLARSLGAHRIAVLHDGDDLFGHDRALLFRRAAARLGLDVVLFRRWDPTAKRYDDLAAAVAEARPDAVFLGGGLYTNGGALIAALRERLEDEVPILAPEFLPIADLFDAAGPAAGGTYVSLIGLTSDGLPPSGRSYLRRFAAVQPGGQADVSTVYAAQAAEALLAAIARSDGTRASVTRQLLRTRIPHGLTGDVTVGPSGDLRRSPITILRAVRGGGSNVVQSPEGGVVDRVIVPPERLAR